MKNIKYALRDTQGFYSIMNFLKDYIPEEYELVEENETPDYLICSCFGKGYLEENTVRIAYIGENLVPDFNVYDYAIGFDNIVFGDRYLRYPLYALAYRKAFLAAVEKHRHVEEFLGKKDRFCGFVVSNGHPEDIRTKFFLNLSEYKRVESGGRFMNNIGHGLKGSEGKLNFQIPCKFAIAFENSSTPGYTTEKIVEAWQAGTVPIYWGNPEIAKEFNSKAFINCHEYESMEQVIEKVKEIDQDDRLYRAMLEEPILYNGCIATKYLDKSYLANFLRNIFDQKKEDAVRRNEATSRFAVYYETLVSERMRSTKNTKNIVRQIYNKVFKR